MPLITHCFILLLCFLSLSLFPSLSSLPPPLRSFIADALSPPHDSGASDHQPHLLGVPCNGSIHPSRSMSHDLKDQAHEILQVPTFELVRSPKCGAFEFESLGPMSSGVKGDLLSVGSRESLHSTSSQ